MSANSLATFPYVYKFLLVCRLILYGPIYHIFCESPYSRSEAQLSAYYSVGCLTIDTELSLTV